MCIAPIAIRDQTGASIYGYIRVPCGKCFECRRDRAKSWSFRLYQEAKRHDKQLFVTLTYSDDNLIYAGDHPTLVKSDLQKFFKRLRWNIKPNKIKYYACGEYGGRTRRPHYHAILFGATHEEVLAAWNGGHVHFGDCSSASIGYVTGYLCKGGLRDYSPCEPEFSVMSKGLGNNYLTPQMIKYHEQNLATYVTNPGGDIQQIPRYYKERIFTEEDRLMLAARAASMHELTEQELIAKYGHEEFEIIKMNSAVAKILQNEYRETLRNKV